jgi:hypothetical protein
MEKSYFESGAEKIPQPGTLDVVMIDGRWAQYLGGSGIAWLDTGEQALINLADYVVERELNFNVDLVNQMQEAGKETLSLSEAEIARIHWQADNNTRHLQGQVNIYGVLVSK